MIDTCNIDESPIITWSKRTTKAKKKEKKHCLLSSQEGGKQLLGKIPEYLLQSQILQPHTMFILYKHAK